MSSLSYDQELSKVRKRFSKLTVNGASTNSLLQSYAESEDQISSPRSVKAARISAPLNTNLKKRRFRQLERHDIFDNINDEFEEHNTLNQQFK